MLTIALWKWGNKYTRDHVARMQSMLSRHLTLPHRIVCLTDKPHDLPSGVEAAALPKKFHGSDQKCMRRIWIYSPKAIRLGDRLLQLDLDVVLTGNIDAIAGRPEPFVIWRSDSNVVHGWGYNPSVLLITPGAQARVWDAYVADPQGVSDRADKAGWWVKVNSDQAVMSYLLSDQDVPYWTEADGIRAYRVFAGKHGDRGKVLPEGTKIVSFHGPRDPSVVDLQKKSPWLRECWC